MSRSTTWRALLGGLLLFALVDCAVFRSGLYAWGARPDSSAGWLTLRTRLEPCFVPLRDQPSIVLLGDSMMTEACDAEALKRLLGDPPLAVRNAGVPGTTPRVWPFLFRALTPPPGGWTLVVAGLAEYDDDGGGEDPALRVHDLSFLGPLLGVGEMLSLVGEFRSPEARRDVWLDAFCKTYAWRRDLQDLLAAPYERYEQVRRQFGHLRWGRPYEGVEASLAGVHVDGDRIVGLPPDKASARDRLRHLVWREHCIDTSAYRRRWLGELADRVTASGAQLVFVRLPTQVLPRAVPRVPHTATLDELARRPGVHVLDDSLFAGLEAPEFFQDALHVDREGRERFTRTLALELRRRFGPLLRR